MIMPAIWSAAAADSSRRSTARQVAFLMLVLLLPSLDHSPDLDSFAGEAAMGGALRSAHVGGWRHRGECEDSRNGLQRAAGL